MKCITNDAGRTMETGGNTLFKISENCLVLPGTNRANMLANMFTIDVIQTNVIFIYRVAYLRPKL